MVRAQEAEAVGVPVPQEPGFAGVNCGQSHEIGSFNTEVEELKCWRAGEVRAERYERVQVQPWQGWGKLIDFRESVACARAVWPSNCEGNQLTRSVHSSLLSWQVSKKFQTVKS